MDTADRAVASYPIRDAVVALVEKVRQPLTGVLGWLDLVDTGNDKEWITECVHRAKHAAHDINAECVRMLKARASRLTPVALGRAAFEAVVAQHARQAKCGVASGMGAAGGHFEGGWDAQPMFLQEQYIAAADAVRAAIEDVASGK